MVTHILHRALPVGMFFCFSMVVAWGEPPAADTSSAPGLPIVSSAPGSPIVFEVTSPHERLEMMVRTSRILQLKQKIPQMQVNNPDLLELTPLSPTQIQVAAKQSGVTQISLWGENQEVYTIDVMIHGDAQELMMLLQTQFPNASLKIIPFSNTVLISGYVEQPEHIEKIVRIAEEYYPKPINNMTVGCVQTVLLHVKVMEVSRTKLRQIGFDWAKITGTNMIMSGVSGLLMAPSSPMLPSGAGSIVPAPPTTANNPVPGNFAFNVAQGSSAFFGVLNALREDNLMKVMAEPTLVTTSGRAASFHAGGQIAIPQPAGLGSVGVDYKKYGTNIDFVPIVLGKGKIRLEIRPSVSELDSANGTVISGTVVPGLRDRNVDTSVELMAGQTIAIAGLVQSRIEAVNHGLPWISEVPYLGAPFRTVHEKVNEVELLILVTPELVDPLDACEVPPCGPGMATASPSDWELYMQGHLEVPNCCPAGEGGGPCSHPRSGNGIQPPVDRMIGPDSILSPEPAGASRSSNPNYRYVRVKSHTSPNEAAPKGQNEPPGFIGPIGYDVIK